MQLQEVCCHFRGKEPPHAPGIRSIWARLSQVQGTWGRPPLRQGISGGQRGIVWPLQSSSLFCEDVGTRGLAWEAP